MKNLINKEIKLVVTPLTYMFALLSALVLVPDYPYMVSMGYCIFGILTTFNIARANLDNEFTANLPISRKNVVLSKYILVIYSELLQVLFCIPFALISTLVLYPKGNSVGMDANIAFLGLSVLLYAVFNVIFLPLYFKTGYKMGVPTIISVTVYVVLAVVIEMVIAFIPQLKNTLDGISKEGLLIRIVVLVVSIVIFIVANILSYKKAVKNFEKVNL